MRIRLLCTEKIGTCYRAYRTPCLFILSFSMHIAPEDCDDGELRLMGGRDEREGRVELCYNGTWGSVADFCHWDFAEASVVCSELGYNPLGRTNSNPLRLGTVTVLLYV